MALKKARTFEEQLQILKDRNLEIQDMNYSKFFLSNVNYYRLSGYLVNYKLYGDSYKAGTSFNAIKELYMFDHELRALIGSCLSVIEVSFRTYLAYTIGINYGALGYQSHHNFANREYHKNFISDVLKARVLNENKLYINHHKENYENQLPIWILVEILNFSTISKLYSNLKPSDKKFIKDNNLCSLPYKRISGWLNSLTALRNECAHYGRLLDIKLPKISISKEYKSENYDAEKLFAYLLAIKDLIASKDIWDSFLDSLNILFSKYKSVTISKIGFPENWFEVLSK